MSTTANRLEAIKRALAHPLYYDGDLGRDIRWLVEVCDRLLVALKAVAESGDDCPACDRGVLRHSENGHWPECPFGRALAVIANSEEPRTVADRLEALRAFLDTEARRHHEHCADSWYCCALCDHPDHGELESHAGECPRVKGVCSCGATRFNARLDAVLTDFA